MILDTTTKDEHKIEVSLDSLLIVEDPTAFEKTNNESLSINDDHTADETFLESPGSSINHNHTNTNLEYDDDDANEEVSSTESEEIIELASETGCKILKRDKSLATNATDGNALLVNEALAVDADIYIQAICTSPFIESETIEKAVNALLVNPLIFLRPAPANCCRKKLARRGMSSNRSRRGGSVMITTPKR